MAKFIDLTGQRFGRLVAIKRVEDQISENGNHKTMWLCKCDCGNTKVVSARELRKENGTRSCGCYRSEYVSTFNRNTKTIHGDRYTRIYREWVSMRARCRDMSKDGYGSKGICVCKEWSDPETGYLNFKHWSLLNGYADNLSIDRINYKGNYCPDNCRWTDAQTQANNRATNRIVTFNGEEMTLTQFADKIGRNRDLILKKLNQGMTPEEIASYKFRKGTPTFTLDGITYNVKEWGIATGYGFNTIYNRMRNHWSPEDIVTIPPMGRYLNAIYFVDSKGKPVPNQMIDGFYFEDPITGEKISQSMVY